MQIAFHNGNLALGMVQGILCLIPKGGGKYHGISLLETLHKICAHIVHNRLIVAIEFHPRIHGFAKERNGNCDSGGKIAYATSLPWLLTSFPNIS